MKLAKEVGACVCVCYFACHRRQQQQQQQQHFHLKMFALLLLLLLNEPQLDGWGFSYPPPSTCLTIIDLTHTHEWERKKIELFSQIVAHLLKKNSTPTFNRTKFD